MSTETDRAVLNATVHELYPRIKRFFRNKLPEPDCYDQANETIRVFLSRDPATVDNPKSYLWGIARKMVLRYINRRGPMGSFDSEQHSIEQFRTRMSLQLTRRNRLNAALASLPVDLQTAFELHHAEDLTIAEVAQVLGKSTAQTKRYLAKAREELASKLGVPPERFSDVETRQVVGAYWDS